MFRVTSKRKELVIAMKLREFYESNGVDYDAFIHRLMGKESLAAKYVKVFLADPTFGELADAVAQKDMDQVGKKAHGLKGIALNLDFKKLGSLCVEVIAGASSANTQQVDVQFDLLKKEYEHIVSDLQSVSADLGA